MNFFTKWLQVAILDVRNSLSIAFLAISDRYATLFFLEIFDKMAAGGHFGCPKFTFDRISGHFRSIGHFGFPKFTFDRNSGHFRSIQNLFSRWPFWMSENHFGSHFWPFQIDRPFWMSEIHSRWHFWPFQIHTELYLFFKIFDKMAAGGHFGCPQITFDRISGHFRSICNFLFFWIFLTKWPPAANLDGTTMSIIELIRDIWMSNACVKFKSFKSYRADKIATRRRTTRWLRCWRKHNIPENLRFSGI